MQKDRTNQTGKWIAIIGGALIIIVIGMLIAKNMKKSQEVVFNVSTVKLAKQKVPHILTIQGILEGDPQVKVYSQVSGKFVRNAIAEGDSVKKDDVISYVDRDMVGYKYELAPVKAPVSGIVTNLYYTDRGDAINTDNPVAEVANEDNVKVVFNLGQDDLLKVQKGQPAQIIFVDDPTISVNGEVSSVPPVIDENIMAGTVVINASNKDKIMKIGMSVNVEIVTEEKESYLVPENAILSGEESSYVYVDRSGKADQVNITTGVKQKDLIEIEGQLADGDEVITNGNFNLFDGANVSTAATIPAAASAPAGNTSTAAQANTPIPVNAGK